MTFNYRFSIIPAGAIIDERLTPRALQVLCLLGRHTNDAGWCSRSQVKMSKELRCGRATIYDAVKLLFDCGWIERKPNGRGSREHVGDEHPFSAYSYRVILDREALPERIADDASSGEEGAAQAAGGAAQAAGGAAPEPAPLEGTPSEGIPSEPDSERERTRARKRAEGLATFEARWPTAAADDRNRTGYAWEALTDDERESALLSIGPFLDYLKRNKRSHPPAGWRYLEEKRWTLLAQKAAESPVSMARMVDVDSDEGRALIVLRQIAHMLPPPSQGGKCFLKQPLSAAALALAHAPPVEEWQLVPVDDRNRCGAWNQFLATELGGIPRPALITDRNPGGVLGFMAPWRWPPRKDGTICDAA